MNEEQTSRLGLPLLQPGQAQKEMFHNEALALIDLLLPGWVAAGGLNDPPVDPGEGDAWIVGPAPTGAWAGQGGALAGWTAGGWRFVPPAIGMAVWDRTREVPLRFDAGGWTAGVLAGTELRLAGQQVVGPRAGAIEAPTGGGTVDVEARAAVAAILAALRGHGLISS